MAPNVSTAVPFLTGPVATPYNNDRLPERRYGGYGYQRDTNKDHQPLCGILREARCDLSCELAFWSYNALANRGM